MESSVSRLDEYREHVCFNVCNGNIHIVPLSLVEDWANGDQEMEKTDDWKCIIRCIISDWLLDNKCPQTNKQ